MNGACIHCKGLLEFESNQLDSVAECPHCGKETVLRKAAEYRVDLEKDRNATRYLLLSVAAVGLIGLMWVVISLAGPVLKEVTPDAFLSVLALAAVIFCIVLALLWLVLPFVVYFGFRHARQSSDTANNLIRCCLRRLEEIAAKDRETASKS